MAFSFTGPVTTMSQPLSPLLLAVTEVRLTRSTIVPSSTIQTPSRPFPENSLPTMLMDSMLTCSSAVTWNPLLTLPVDGIVHEDYVPHAQGDRFSL